MPILRSNNLLIGTIIIGTPTLLVPLEFGSPVPGTLHKGFALQTACLPIREAPRHAKYYVAVKHSCYISKTDRPVLVDGRTYASYHDARAQTTDIRTPHPRARSRNNFSQDCAAGVGDWRRRCFIHTPTPATDSCAFRWSTAAY